MPAFGRSKAVVLRVHSFSAFREFLKRFHMWSPMAKKTEHKSDDPEQSKRFIDAAKEAGADETEAGADRAFKNVASKKKKSS
jgi:hypothetical protein